MLETITKSKPILASWLEQILLTCDIKVVKSSDDVRSMSKENFMSLLNDITLIKNSLNRHNCKFHDILQLLAQSPDATFVGVSDTNTFNGLLAMSDTEFDSNSNHFAEDKLKLSQDGRKDNGGHPCYRAEQTASKGLSLVRATGIPYVISVGSLTSIDYKTRFTLRSPMKKEISFYAVGECEIVVLIQALERVFVYANTNQTVARISCFATTMVHSWLVLFERNFSNDTGGNPCLYIINIERVAMFELYDWFNHQCLKDPYFNFSEDWYVIRDLLESCGIDATRCGIVNTSDKAHFKTSSSRLYKIFLPRDVSMEDNTGLALDSEDDYELVIKINGDATIGQHEVDIINHVNECWKHQPDTSVGCSPVAYVIATLSSQAFDGEVKNFYTESNLMNNLFDFLRTDTQGVNDAQAIDVDKSQDLSQRVEQLSLDLESSDNRPSHSKQSASIEAFAKASECPDILSPSAFKAIQDGKGWWQRNSKSLQSSSLNGILMIRGFPNEEVEFVGLLTKLQYLHNTARIFHTDLRPVNLMSFPAIPGIIPESGMSFMIDFDLAQSLPPGASEVEITLDNGGRSDMVRSVLRNSITKDKTTVSWNSRMEINSLSLASAAARSQLSVSKRSSQEKHKSNSRPKSGLKASFGMGKKSL